MTAVGLSLQPDEEFLALLAPLIHRSLDYVEIAPETTWWHREDGELVENRYHRRFAELVGQAGIFAVAHGVGLSMATMDEGDRPRRERWLQRVERDQKTFGYRWYSDHLGASSLAGQNMTLAVPVPWTSRRIDVVQCRLRAMQEAVGEVALENSTFYFTLGSPLAEADALARIVRPADVHLLLDLHNLYTASVNAELDVAGYLDRLPLHKVIEIHLSGGSESDAGWLRDAGTLRLDSHDGSVPEPVWRLFETVLPRCRNLRGVTLERMEGTVGPDDVLPIGEELRRIRAIIAGRRGG